MNSLLLAAILLSAGQPKQAKCNAFPYSILPGDTATITCSCKSVSAWSAQAGTITSTGITATFSSAGAPVGRVAITAICAGVPPETETVYVTVEAPPPPPAPQMQDLCPVTYGVDRSRPSRVTNVAKACLDQVAIVLEMQPDATLAVVGQSTEVGKKGIALATKRTINVKNYLVNEKKIDPARITLWTSHENADRASDILIPAGANFPEGSLGLTPVEDSKFKPSPRSDDNH